MKPSVRDPARSRAANRLALLRRCCGGENLVELVERIIVPTDAPGADGFVESLRRSIEIVHDELRSSIPFLERDGSDLPRAACFFIGPDEARRRSHFEIPAVESHGLRVTRVAEHEAVRATDTNIELAGEHLQGKRLRNPPTLEQLGVDPCLE